MTTRSDITPELCRQLLRYDPETGKLFWRRRPREMFVDARSCSVWNARYADKQAFTASMNGYRVGRILDFAFKAHRVAWAMTMNEWPPADHDVDHINGNPSDNRIQNLRSVPHQTNNMNNRRPKDNKSGHVGVSWNKRVGRWEAYISAAGKRQTLGHFTNIDDAISIRKNAEIAHGYHPNHGR